MAQKQSKLFTDEDFPWANLRKFAEFWIANKSQRDRIVRNIKHPPQRKNQDKKGFDKRGVWGAAFITIKKYHSEEKDITWLLTQAKELESEALKLESRKSAYRHCNARAIRDYAQHFAHMRFVILPDQKLVLHASDVIIKVVPDLVVQYNEDIMLLKFFFTNKQSKDDQKLSRKICELLFAAQLEKGMNIAPENIMHLGVSRGLIMRGIKNNYDLTKEINKVAHAYKQIWESVKTPICSLPESRK